MDIIIFGIGLIVLGVALYHIVKNAIKNGIKESILVSDEQREAYRQKEEINRRPKRTLEAKLKKMMKPGDHEKIQ